MALLSLARTAQQAQVNLLGVKSAQKVLSASITSKLYRECRSTSKPPPFPYRQKNYSLLRSMFDRTTHRFDDNSKIIVVDGPVGSGKTEFAKHLANEFEMLYMADANMDMVYINSGGYDMRQLNDKLPASMKSFDEKDFCRDPHHPNVAAFQIWMYRLRFSLYIDALAHVLSTGQGVVMERCPWSDRAFLETMYSHGYISSGARRAYYTLRDNTLEHLMRPHLIIYLNVPVDGVLKNIKKKNRPYEVNSKALTKQYLQSLEENYKSTFLRDIQSHCEIVVYDWADGGDMEAVVEDIERIDFDIYTKGDSKLEDWRKHKEQAWADTRMLYADQKGILMSYFNIPIMDVPELVVDGEDIQKYNAVCLSAPGMDNYRCEEATLFSTGRSKYVPY